MQRFIIVGEAKRILIKKLGVIEGRLAGFVQIINSFDGSPAVLVGLEKRTKKLEPVWGGFVEIESLGVNTDDCSQDSESELHI